MNNKDMLLEAIINEDFYSTNDLLVELLENGKSKEYIELLINFIRDNPNIDYGMPGPVIHFIEKHSTEEYLEYLLNAINDKPNETLLWMLNRIVNDPNEPKKEIFVDIFNKTANRNDVSDSVKAMAKDFYNYQTGK